MDGSRRVDTDDRPRLALAAAAALLLLTCSDASSDETDADTGEVSLYGVCPDSQALLSHLPIELAQIDLIIPMGSTTGGGSHTLPTNHIYVNAPFHREDTLVVPDILDVPVVAPADVTVTAIRGSIRTAYNSNHEPVGEYEDFTVYLQVCDDVRIYFHHLNTISEPLREAAGDLLAGEGYCRPASDFSPVECTAYIDVPVAAGASLGTAWRPGTQALDWGLVDARVMQPFANLDRYAFTPSDQEGAPPEELQERTYVHKPSVQCPLDYLADPALQQAAKDLLAGYENYAPSTFDPPCGAVNFDLPGTARGAWFGDGGFYDTALALVNHHVDPTIPIFSPGAELADVPEDNYTFEIRDDGFVNRRFEDVRDDAGTHCWEGLLRFHEPPSTLAHGGRILLRVDTDVDGPAMTFEYQPDVDLCGDPATWVFSPAAFTLRR